MVSDYSLEGIFASVQRFLRNSSWMMAGQLATIGGGLILNVVFANVATRESFGLYTFLLSTLSLVGIVSMPGTGGAVLRAVSRGQDATYRDAFWFRFRWALIGIPILLAAGFYYIYVEDSRVIGVGLLLGSVLFPLYKAVEKWPVIYEGKELFAKRSQLEVANSFLRTLVVGSVIFITSGDALIAFLVAIGFEVVFSCYAYFRGLNKITSSSAEEGWKLSSYKLSVGGAFNLLFENLDKILIGSLLGPGELAIYSIAIAAGNKLRGLIGGVLRIFTPTIYTDGKFTWDEFVLFSIGLVGGIAVLWILLPFLIPFLFSEKYLPSVPYAQWYLLVLPLYVIDTLASSLVINYHQEWLTVGASTLSSIINIGLYLLLIPTYGIAGAIVASGAYFAVRSVAELGYLWYSGAFCESTDGSGDF